MVYKKVESLLLEEAKYTGRLLDVIAIPANMLTYRRKGNILEIVPLMPKIRVGGSSEEVALQVLMKPYGKIPLTDNTTIGKYAKISNGKISGYLVFERTNHVESEHEGHEVYRWNLVDRVPEAFLVSKKIKSNLYVSIPFIYDSNNRFIPYIEEIVTCNGKSCAVTLFSISPKIQKIVMEVHFENDTDDFVEKRYYTIDWNIGVPSLKREENPLR